MNDFFLDNDICCEFSEIHYYSAVEKEFLYGEIESVDMSPDNTFDKVNKTLTQSKKIGNKTTKYFSYEPQWYDHGSYARCQVKDVNGTVFNATKRFSVFFPPEIIVKPLPKIETGRTLKIEVEIRANPFNEDKVAKPITDDVR